MKFYHYLRKFNSTDTLFVPLELSNELISSISGLSNICKRSLNGGIPANFSVFGFLNQLFTITDTFTTKTVHYFIVDTQFPKRFDDIVIMIETFGNANAKYPFDFNATSFNVDNTTFTNILSIKTKTDQLNIVNNKVISTLTGSNQFDIVGSLSGSVGFVSGNINGNVLGTVNKVVGLNVDYIDTTISSMTKGTINVKLNSTIVDLNGE